MASRAAVDDASNAPLVDEAKNAGSTRIDVVCVEDIPTAAERGSRTVEQSEWMLEEPRPMVTPEGSGERALLDNGEQGLCIEPGEGTSNEPVEVIVQILFESV